MSAVGPTAAQISFTPAEAPLSNAAAVDVSSTDFNVSTVFNSGFATAIYVGSATGDVVVQLVGDSSPVTLKTPGVGMIRGLKIAKVIKTGTTATNLLVFVGG